MNNFDQAIKYLAKGDLLKHDAVEVLLDHETPEDILPDVQLNCMRYSLINSGVALIANCARNAVSLKPKIGKHAYTVQTVIELFRGRSETFDIDIDNGKTLIPDMQT